MTQVVEKNSGGTVQWQTDYTYDAFNRRIIIEHDSDGPGATASTMIKTMYDSMQPPTADRIARGTTSRQPDGSFVSALFMANTLLEFDKNDSLQTRFLHGPDVDMILARRDGSGNVDWYLTDNLGSVRDIVDTSGTQQDHISYNSSGGVEDESAPSVGDRWKFNGREYDDNTMILYVRARYAESDIGQWIAEDPIGFIGEDTNLRRIVQNDQISLSDPSGLIIYVLPHPGWPYPVGGGVPMPPVPPPTWGSGRGPWVPRGLPTATAAGGVSAGAVATVAGVIVVAAAAGAIVYYDDQRRTSDDEFLELAEQLWIEKQTKFTREELRSLKYGSGTDKGTYWMYIGVSAERELREYEASLPGFGVTLWRHYKNFFGLGD